MCPLRSSLRVCGRRLAAALLWVGLLGGVFAMHGLSTHGTPEPLGAVSAAMDHAAGEVHDVMQAGAPGPDDGHPEMAMLCLAILAAAISMAWAFRFEGRRSIFEVMWLRHRFLPRPGTTHPPPLAHLLVMRC